MTDAYRQGLNVLASMGILPDDARNRLAEVSPDFARIAIAFPFGEIASRSVLDPKARALLAVSVTAASGHALPQLHMHVTAALHLGWSQEEVVEAIIQVAALAGFPAALNALTHCHDLLVKGGDYCSPCQMGVSSEGQA